MDADAARITLALQRKRGDGFVARKRADRPLVVEILPFAVPHGHVIGVYAAKELIRLAAQIRGRKPLVHVQAGIHVLAILDEDRDGLGQGVVADARRQGQVVQSFLREGVPADVFFRPVLFHGAPVALGVPELLPDLCAIRHGSVGEADVVKRQFDTAAHGNLILRLGEGDLRRQTRRQARLDVQRDFGCTLVQPARAGVTDLIGDRARLRPQRKANADAARVAPLFQRKRGNVLVAGKALNRPLIVEIVPFAVPDGHVLSVDVSEVRISFHVQIRGRKPLIDVQVRVDVVAILDEDRDGLGQGVVADARRHGQVVQSFLREGVPADVFFRPVLFHGAPVALGVPELLPDLCAIRHGSVGEADVVKRQFDTAAHGNLILRLGEGDLRRQTRRQARLDVQRDFGCTLVQPARAGVTDLIGDRARLRPQRKANADAARVALAIKRQRRGIVLARHLPDRPLVVKFVPVAVPDGHVLSVDVSEVRISIHVQIRGRKPLVHVQAGIHVLAILDEDRDGLGQGVVADARRQGQVVQSFLREGVPADVFFRPVLFHGAPVALGVPELLPDLCAIRHGSVGEADVVKRQFDTAAHGNLILRLGEGDLRRQTRRQARLDVQRDFGCTLVQPARAGVTDLIGDRARLRPQRKANADAARVAPLFQRKRGNVLVAGKALNRPLKIKFVPFLVEHNDIVGIDDAEELIFLAVQVRGRKPLIDVQAGIQLFAVFDDDLDTLGEEVVGDADGDRELVPPFVMESFRANVVAGPFLVHRTPVAIILPELLPDLLPLRNRARRLKVNVVHAEDKRIAGMDHVLTQERRRDAAGQILRKSIHHRYVEFIGTLVQPAQRRIAEAVAHRALAFRQLKVNRSAGRFGAGQVQLQRGIVSAGEAFEFPFVVVAVFLPELRVHPAAAQVVLGVIGAGVERGVAQGRADIRGQMLTVLDDELDFLYKAVVGDANDGQHAEAAFVVEGQGAHSLFVVPGLIHLAPVAAFVPEIFPDFLPRGNRAVRFKVDVVQREGQRITGVNLVFRLERRRDAIRHILRQAAQDRHVKLAGILIQPVQRGIGDSVARGAGFTRQNEIDGRAVGVLIGQRQVNRIGRAVVDALDLPLVRLAVPDHGAVRRDVAQIVLGRIAAGVQRGVPLEQVETRIERLLVPHVDGDRVRGPGVVLIPCRGGDQVAARLVEGQDAGVRRPVLRAGIRYVVKVQPGAIRQRRADALEVVVVKRHRPADRDGHILRAGVAQARRQAYRVLRPDDHVKLDGTLIAVRHVAGNGEVRRLILIHRLQVADL